MSPKINMDFEVPSKMLKRRLYGYVFIRRTLCYKLTVWKDLKMLKLLLTFVFVALQG